MGCGLLQGEEETEHNQCQLTHRSDCSHDPVVYCVSSVRVCSGWSEIQRHSQCVKLDAFGNDSAVGQRPKTNRAVILNKTHAFSIPHPSKLAESVSREMST